MRRNLLSLRNRIVGVSIALFLLFAVIACGFLFVSKPSQAEGEHASFDHADAKPYTGVGGAIESGNYYYDGNYLMSSIVIGDGVVVNFCLNGQNVRADLSPVSNFSIFRIEQGGVLNLYDCKGTGSVSGGKGTSDEGVLKGGGVYVQNGGTFNMYGGEITNNTADYGAGVEVEGGTFVMYGGKITFNSAFKEGGGVNVSRGGSVTIAGGEISGNSAEDNGGGIYICYLTGASSLSLHGGTIKGNSAKSGGGVYLVDSDCTLSVKGSVNVTGNTGGNVYLNATNSKITVDGALTDGNAKAQIGITLVGNTGSFANGFSQTYGNPSDYFISDNGSYYCDVSGNAVELKQKTSVNVEDVITRWEANGITLSDGTVYMKGDVAYRTEIDDADSSLTVVNAIAAYDNGNTITVRLVNDSSSEYTVTYSQNTGSDSSIYTSYATITAGATYEFSTINTSEIDPQCGVTVMSQTDTVIFLSKVWYIAEADNAILDQQKSIARGTPVAFAVEDRVFGVIGAIGTPRLKYGATDSTLAFTLTLNGSNIVSTPVDISLLSDYINVSMPAGRYELIIHAPNVVLAAGSDWWGSSTHEAENCEAFDVEYSFTVEAAEFDLDITPSPRTGYADYEWKYDAENKASFFDGFKSELYKGLTYTDEYTDAANRIGFWKDSISVGAYYGIYSVTFNFLRLQNNTYYLYDNAELHKSITSGTNATYIVYFRISAANHKTVSSADDRYGYYFTVTVYEEITLPDTIGSVTYTGSKITVPIPASSIYETVLDGDDDYISGGMHNVTLKLFDPVHYRWASGIKTSGENGECATLSFEVLQTTNTWLRTPNIVGWEYGSYTSEKNYIIAIPTYGSAQDIELSIATDENGSKLVSGLESFNVDENGVVSDDIKAKLEKLEYGTYWLIAELAETKNYTALAKQSTSFNVSKTVSYWTKSLSIVSWIKGEYDPETNIITVQSNVGDIVLVITDIDKGIEYYNSATGVNDLANAPVGRYKLSATVSASDSYTALGDSIEFRIFEASTVVKGFPWWAVLLIVLGIVFIVVLILFILYKKGIFQLVSEKMVVAIRTRADTDATIAAVRAGKIAAEAERSKEEARLREEALAAEQAAIDAASDEEEAQPEDDDDENGSYEPEDDDVEVPSSEGFEKVFMASNSGEEITYAKTVLSKLISAPDIVKTRYSDLKNYLLGFKKARANMSRARETFYIGRKCYARIAVRGKTMCLYLALNPADCDDKYNVEDVLNVKAYVDTPCLLRIRSERALRYAKELIDQLMSKNGAVKIDRKPENYAELFRSIELLEKKNLLSYGVKKKKSNSNNFNKGDK